MKNSTSSFKTIEGQKRGRIWNGKSLKVLAGTNVQINEKKYDITPGCQKFLVNSSYDTLESRSDMDRLVFRDMSHTTDYYKRPSKKGRL